MFSKIKISKNIHKITSVRNPILRDNVKESHYKNVILLLISNMISNIVNKAKLRNF